MALVECPECRSSVSDRAASCPKCGRPAGRDCPSSWGRLRRWVCEKMDEKAMLAIVIVGCAVWLAQSVPFAFFRGPVAYYVAKAVPCAAFLVYFLVRYMKEP